MAKLDKSQYTKEEWNTIKRLRRERKAEDRHKKATDRLVKQSEYLGWETATDLMWKEEDNATRFVCCLKYGDKYSADYVNKLYDMVQRNLTLDHEFVCFTEDPTGINPNIRIESLPELPVKGWWFKPMFFNPNLALQGTLLFLDLDLIIFKNIDHLFKYEPGKFCIIRDFNRYIIKSYNKFNSSVFRLETGQHSNVYHDFVKDAKNITKRLQGDQDWIRACISNPNDFKYWPDDWIESYKWEMRNKPKFDAKPRGERDFLVNGDPKINPNTSIAVFHGDPNPHNCKDQWVIDNWK
jgi:hypothetical protein